MATAGSLLLIGDDWQAELAASHAVLPDGSLVLSVSALSPLGGRLVSARGGQVVAAVTELVPVAVRQRVRARVSLHGTLSRLDPARLVGCEVEAVLGLLDLPVGELWSVSAERVDVAFGESDAGALPEVADSGRHEVAPTEYRDCGPDPIADDEPAVLDELVRAGAAQRLAPLVGLAGTADRLVPVMVDSAGVTLRVESDVHHRDVRVAFPTVARWARDVPELLGALLERADAVAGHGAG